MLSLSMVKFTRWQNETQNGRYNVNVHAVGNCGCWRAYAGGSWVGCNKVLALRFERVVSSELILNKTR
jgi:hypothetical protein